MGLESFGGKVKSVIEKVRGTPEERLETLENQIKELEEEIPTIPSHSMRQAEEFGLKMLKDKRDKLQEKIALGETE